MRLPRFDFAPHEWPPSAYGEHEGVANVAFRTNWNGEDAEVMARWVKLSGSVILFFRVPEKAQDTWLVASHEYTPAQFGFMVGHATPSHIAASAQAQAEHAIKMSFFGRARNFDASSFGFLEKEWLYLSVDGQKGCWNGAGSSLNSAIFKLKAEPPSFSQEIADPSSDVRFALRWSHLSPDERLLEAIRFGQSDLNELRSVVRAVGIAEATRRNLPKDWTVVFADALRFGENSLRTLDPKNKNARLRRWSHHIARPALEATDEG